MKARDTGMGRGNFRKKQAGKSTLLALVIDEKDGVLKYWVNTRSYQRQGTTLASAMSARHSIYCLLKYKQIVIPSSKLRHASKARHVPEIDISWLKDSA